MRHDVGELDQRIQVYYRTRVSDGGGGYEVTENLLGTYWAKVISVAGDEKKEYEKVTDTSTEMFIVRYTSQITEGMRIVYLSQDYNIKRVKRVGGRELYTEIVADRGITQ